MFICVMKDMHVLVGKTLNASLELVLQVKVIFVAMIVHLVNMLIQNKVPLAKNALLLKYQKVLNLQSAKVARNLIFQANQTQEETIAQYVKLVWNLTQTQIVA